jgi:hypothetical protein
MPAGVTCYLGDFRLGGNAPAINNLLVHPNAGSSAAQTPGSVFLQASGPAALDVAFDWSRRDSVAKIPHFKSVSVADLSAALNNLLAGAIEQPEVGLLLADYFEPDPTQYGAMFDLDTHASGSPRQGCAIFVTAIMLALKNAGVGNDPSALLEFISYTAIHEIGHAFNLWHIDGSYMQPYPHPESPGPYGFVDKQKNYLALAANPNDARFVLPGPGCSNYGERPEGWRGLDDSNPLEGPAPRSPTLKLQIGLSHQSFYSFEPVELDVCLALPRGVKKPVDIPNEIDPGYDSFQIWITEPSGERRRYRSLTRFCRSHGKCTVSPKKPYRRDISIFRQSGGSTFRAVGRHLIQVVFRISPRRTLWSNIVECEVKSADSSSETWLAGRELLGSLEGRELLRFKTTLAPAAHDNSFTRFADKHAAPETAAAIHYALGKSFLHRAAHSDESKETRQWLKKGLKYLEKALASTALGPHRRRVIEGLLDGRDLSSPAIRRRGARGRPTAL